MESDLKRVGLIQESSIFHINRRFCHRIDKKCAINHICLMILNLIEIEKMRKINSSVLNF